MKPHEKVLLDLIGRALFDARVTFPANTDWQAVYREAVAQTVPILALQALTAEERAGVPAEVLSAWTRDMLLHSAHGVQLVYEQQTVLSLMRENGIPCAVLKGSSVACHYPAPAHRVMGDIDILVPPDRQEAAVRILQSAGYGEVLEENHHCHFTVSKDRITVEVHREPNGIHIVSDPRIAERLRSVLADTLADIHAVEEIPVLSASHQALVLLLHKLEHFLDGALGLRQLCDWACFVRARFTPNEWDRLRPILSECGLMEFAGIITRVCCDRLHLPVEVAPWCMDFDRGLAEEVAEAILATGNFGCKEANTLYGQRFLVDPASSGRVSSFFKLLGSACRYHWPVCSRHKLLMPIAPFVVWIKYLKMRIKGERPAIHPVRLYRSAGPRQKLYQSLKPFQGVEP